MQAINETRSRLLWFYHYLHEVLGGIAGVKCVCIMKDVVEMGIIKLADLM